MCYLDDFKLFQYLWFAVCYPFEYVSKLGFENDENAAVREEKRLSCYYTIFAFIATCLFSFVMVWPELKYSKNRINNFVVFTYHTTVQIMAMGSIIIYILSKRHCHIRSVSLFLNLIYAPVLHLSDGCQLRGMGDIYQMGIPGVCIYLLLGGRKATAVLGIILHLVVIVIGYAFAISGFSGRYCPVPVRSDSFTPSLSFLCVFSAQGLLGICLLKFLHILIQQSTYSSYHSNLAETLASHIAKMELEDLDMLVTTPDVTHTEDLLLQIASKLRNYKRFLPDTIFIEDQSEVIKPPSSVDFTIDRGNEKNHLNHNQSKPHIPIDSFASDLSTDPENYTTSFVSRRKVQFSIGLIQRVVSVLYISLEELPKLIEQLSIDEIQTVLVDLIQEAEQHIKANRGTLVTYGSGQIIAVWASGGSHASNACFAGCSINAAWNKVKQRPKMSIAVVTTKAVVGHAGTSTYTSYNIVAQSFPVLQLLVKLNGYLGTNFIINDTTFRDIQYNFVARPVDILKSNTVRHFQTIYELLYPKSVENPTEWMYELRESPRSDEYIQSYRGAWASFVSGEFVEALKKFESLCENHNDLHCKRMIRLCKSPPRTPYVRNLCYAWETFEGERPAET